MFDPEVLKAVDDEAKAKGEPKSVTHARARRYAREIVPAFSAYAYFRVGAALAKWLSTALYRVRIGAFEEAELYQVPPDASVVFVINHRSNMDYVLVTYLVSESSALSYAVGEWARVWALQRPDPRHGRLFRAPRQLQPALPQGAGALRAHGDRLGRHPGRVPRRRAHARRQRCGRRSWGCSATWCRASIPTAPATSCSCRSASTTTACWRTAS